MNKRGSEQDIQIEPVHLTPFLGMRPGVYLTILYVLVFVVVLFLVGFLPGILGSGKRVTFSSTVEPAAVSVDGTYVGSAPVTVFIEPGTHEAVYSFNDEFSESVTFEVAHPVFFTWLIPRTQTVHAESFIRTLPAFRTYLERMFEQLVSWSVPSPSEQYHRPPVLRQAADTAKQLGIQGSEELFMQFLASAFAYIQDSTSLEEAKSILASLDDAGYIGENNHNSLERTLEMIEPLFDESTRSVVGLPSFAQEIPLTRTALTVPGDGNPSVTGFHYDGLTFVKGKPVEVAYPAVHAMGVTSEVEEFSIAALETSEYQWARFMEANPYWAKSNLEKLVADDMVDAQYLAGVYPTVTVPSNRPIRNISWNAAKAYADWLSQLTGIPVFLPSEEQWEVAAYSVKERPYLSSTVTIADSAGPSAMLGGLWEFTSTPYVPLSRFLGGVQAFTSTVGEVVVKGGSYLNDPSAVERTTVGVLSRTECSETTSFRIAWKD